MQAIKAKPSQAEAAWPALRELFCRPSGKQNAEHQMRDTGHGMRDTRRRTRDTADRTHYSRLGAPDSKCNLSELLLGFGCLNKS